MIVSLLAFLAFQIIPGDPVTKMLGTGASAGEAAELRSRLGLDRPVIVRYLEWLRNFLRGDFGVSYTYNMPVSQMLSDKLPVTVLLTLISFLFTVVIALPLGMLSGGARSRKAGHIFLVIDQVLMAVPPFFLGIMACFVFGIVLKWFTPGNFISPGENLRASAGYMVLPALSLAIPRIAMTAKLLRGSIRKELTQDYVLTARSRGLNRREILLRHVMRNAMIPVVTFLAVNAAEIMTGTIIAEQVFTIPGIGRLLLASIGSRDFPVVQAVVVIMAAWIVIVNFAADMLNSCIDPRLRAEP